MIMTETPRTRMMVPITMRNVLGHEIIGLHILVFDSTDPGTRGVHGTVIDETKNTLKIETSTGTRIVLPKSESCFELELPLSGKKLRVDGSMLLERPWTRTKKLSKVLRKWR